ncbi:TPA: hypothetical protein ACHY7P_005631, partial [Escherichia coli]
GFIQDIPKINPKINLIIWDLSYIILGVVTQNHDYTTGTGIRKNSLSSGMLCHICLHCNL